MTTLPLVDFQIATAITGLASASGDSQFTERYHYLLETTVARFAEELRSGEASDLVQFLELLARCSRESRAQLFQDLWVLHETATKRDGFFVEFGAADGLGFSNTYLLERGHGWRGIVAEPNPDYWESLARNRACAISKKCVFPGGPTQRTFRCTADGHYSTLAEYVDKDQHGPALRSAGFKDIEVETVSLHDLLVEYGAPRTINYMSIDTEGSEFDILSEFSFEHWNIELLTVEHNNTGNRQKIFDLLNSNGYTRKFEGLSRWDDWYVRRSL